MTSFPDLKGYFQTNYYDFLVSEVKDFVDKSLDGIGFHGINVFSLTDYEIENLVVKTLRCHDDIGPKIRIDIVVEADVVELSLGTKRIEAARKKRWFTISIEAILRGQFKSINVNRVDEYFNWKFEKENALDQFLVPYIYSVDLEEQANDYIDFYYEYYDYEGYKIPLDIILEDQNLKYYYAEMSNDCFGRIYFKEDKATIYEKDPITRVDLEVKDKVVDPGTILINRDKYFLGNEGTKTLTIAHELIHWHLHKKYFDLLSLLDEHKSMVSCEVEPGDISDDMTLAQKAHWYSEWQANALAIRIAMPQKQMIRAFNEITPTLKGNYKFTGDLVEELLRRVASLFDVPIFSAKLRARQLDFDDADGAFVYVDGVRYEPFWFTEGTLDKRQTFILNQQSYNRLIQTNKELASLIESGKFIYLGYVICINDPKYIKLRRIDDKYILTLSDYAREHADECCLVFSWSSNSYLKQEYEFYGQAYLSKHVSAENYIEHTFDKDFNLKSIQAADEIKEAVDMYLSVKEEDNKIMIEMLKEGCNDFPRTLVYHMDRKNITVEEVAARSNLSDTTIKNYRGGKANPPIENVMAVCIGLNLKKPLAIDLLNKASYTLGDTKRGIAYNFLLDYSDGTIEQWNDILDAFGENSIPNQKNQNKKTL